MSNDDSTNSIPVSAEDILKYPWQELLAKAPDKECNDYLRVFAEAARECEAANDERGQAVYSFLWLIASYIPSHGCEISPYRPMEEYGGKRSPIPDDLTDEQLDALEGIVGEIEDPEYRARVADLLWVCRKDYQASKLAVTSYVASAGCLKSGPNWPAFIDRLTRAASIAARKGFESHQDEIVTFVEKAIEEFENDLETGLCCAMLLRILLGFERGDVTRYIALSERLAREFPKRGEWHFAEHYWRIAERWHRISKNEEALQQSMIEAAESTIARAEYELTKNPPKSGSSAPWMGKGLQALRRAKADPERIKEVHRRFLALQKQSLGELETFAFDPAEHPGFSESLEKACKVVCQHVSGHDFESAILRLALMMEPTNVKKLAEDEAESSKGSVWLKLIGSERLDLDGKVVDSMPPLDLDNGSDSVAERKRLVELASMFVWPYAVSAAIEPARYTIAQEHPIRMGDLAFLVEHNPFIRAGREGIYLRGIQAGFFGDWLVAMHLLIPQLEDSLRYILQQQGIVTSTMNSDNIQEERDINKLLDDEAVAKLLGPNVVFDLRGILIERFGSNMRNELAHGLMPHSSFYGHAAPVYLWWIIIRLCWQGYRISQRVPDPDAGPSETEDTP